MNKDDQNINGLAAAYSAVYHRPIKYRVKELIRRYGFDKVDGVCTELNPGNSVPCFWKVSELAEHYGYKDLPKLDREEFRKVYKF